MKRGTLVMLVESTRLPTSSLITFVKFKDPLVGWTDLYERDCTALLRRGSGQSGLAAAFIVGAPFILSALEEMACIGVQDCAQVVTIFPDTTDKIGSTGPGSFLHDVSI